jgi:hypothetical protein
VGEQYLQTKIDPADSSEWQDVLNKILWKS